MAPVVGVEAVGGGIGEASPEGAEPVGVGAAETVQQLVLVAHHADVAVRLRQPEDDLLLGTVGVLILVHQDVVKIGSQTGSQRIVAQQLQRLLLQTTEVDGVQLRQQPLIAPVASTQRLKEGALGTDESLVLDAFVGDAVEEPPPLPRDIPTLTPSVFIQDAQVGTEDTVMVNPQQVELVSGAQYSTGWTSAGHLRCGR